MNNLLTIEIKNDVNLTTYPFKSKLYQKGFKIELSSITIIIGENGVGKSTLLESLAYNIGFSTYGGNASTINYFNEMSRVIEHNSHKNLETITEEFNLNPDKIINIDSNLLSNYIHLEWFVKSNKGAFIRAETFATLINLPRYNASNLSHGEGLIEIISKIKDDGLYILDEPESGLSPNKIIELIALIIEKQKVYNAQFIISTHSPILMSMPNCKLLEMTNNDIKEVKVEDTNHYRLTKYILECKDKFFKNLLN